MTDIEFIAYSYYKKVAVSQIYTKHIDNIEKEVLNNPMNDYVPILIAMKGFYINNIEGKIFFSKESRTERQFLIENVCLYIDDKIKFLNRIPPENPTKNSFKIKGKLNDKEVENYFMQLTDIPIDYPKAEKERVSVLTEAQVKQLLSNRDENICFPTPNFNQHQMRIFIYNFKKLHISKGENKVMDFVRFEIENFEVFSGLLMENEYSNFNKGNVRVNNTPQNK